MSKQMDPLRAARLLEKWFSFYGMDDPDAWPPEDYPQVKKAYEAMQLAVEALRGKTLNKKVEIPKAHPLRGLHLHPGGGPLFSVPISPTKSGINNTFT
jgi:hypothetical protein